MKQTFSIPECGWEVTVYYAVGKTGAKEVAEKLESIGCGGSVLTSARGNLERAALDTGLTYSNYGSRSSVMVIHKASNVGEFVNTISHEKTHLLMHICDAMDINPYSEDAARLSGDVSQILLEKALRSIVSL